MASQQKDSHPEFNRTLFYKKYGKRLFDLFISVPVFILLLPLYIALVCLVFLTIGSPVIFRQARPGFNGKPFSIFKFRTMNNKRDGSGNLLPDSERLNCIGIILRKLSLDELPELWIVITGDMSLVGPRPLLMEYLPYYTRREMTRHSVKPGLTGLAQVNGRNLLQWDQRLEMDAQYAEACNFILDIKVLLKTVANVVIAKDTVAAPGTKFGKLSTIRATQKAELGEVDGKNYRKET